MNFRGSLPEQRPEELSTEDYWHLPFLTQGDASANMDWSLVQEPLELIAHVIMTDKPYRQILTADFTMVNTSTDPVYRAGGGFPEKYTDANGLYDRRELRSSDREQTRGMFLGTTSMSGLKTVRLNSGVSGMAPCRRSEHSRLVGALSVDGYQP